MLRTILIINNMNDNTLGFNYNRITWQKDGIPLFFGGKLNFTLEDKAILKNLLSKNIIPTSYLPNVLIDLLLNFTLVVVYCKWS